MRCHGCDRDRRWPASARFCGRCGAPLDGARPPGTHRDRGSPPAGSTGAARGPRGLRATVARLTGGPGAVLLVAVAGAVVAGLLVATLPDGTGASGDAVSIPSARPSDGTTVVRAADRHVGPADCGDHLQELPRPIRRGGLYTGTLEWRDGRLCRPLPPTDGEPPPRCEPPSVPVCVVP